MWASKNRGFTIVELLIVIVVIGILAGLTVLGFSNVQKRAVDAARISDMQTIMKALQMYKETNGMFPTHGPSGNAWGWEVSTTGTGPTTFLDALSNQKIISKVPVDPVNKGSASGTGVSEFLAPDVNNPTVYEYFYYRGAAGTNGCDAAWGDWYVLGITQMATVPYGQKSPNNPPAPPCGYTSLNNVAWYTVGFANR